MAQDDRVYLMTVLLRAAMIAVSGAHRTSQLARARARLGDNEFFAVLGERLAAHLLECRGDLQLAAELAIPAIADEAARGRMLTIVNDAIGDTIAASGNDA